MKIKLIEKIAVVFELCGGAKMSEAALDMLIADLEAYPEQAVSEALDRCRREVKGHLSPSDIISRIDDGRPGPDEAWGMCPKSEYETVVWTSEMSEAHGACVGLIESGDLVAARKTFIEVYAKRTTTSRSSCLPVKWEVSLGFNKSGREGALCDAIRLGRLSADSACSIMPECSEYFLMLLPDTGPVPELTDGRGVDELVSQLADGMKI
jgi:hypothetical protein